MKYIICHRLNLGVRCVGGLYRLNFVKPEVIVGNNRSMSLSRRTGRGAFLRRRRYRSVNLWRTVMRINLGTNSALSWVLTLAGTIGFSSFAVAGPMPDCGSGAGNIKDEAMCVGRGPDSLRSPQ